MQHNQAILQTYLNLKQIIKNSDISPAACYFILQTLTFEIQELLNIVLEQEQNLIKDQQDNQSQTNIQEAPITIEHSNSGQE